MPLRGRVSLVHVTKMGSTGKRERASQSYSSRATTEHMPEYLPYTPSPSGTHIRCGRIGWRVPTSNAARLRDMDRLAFYPTYPRVIVDESGRWGLLPCSERNPTSTVDFVTFKPRFTCIWFVL